MIIDGRSSKIVYIVHVQDAHKNVHSCEMLCTVATLHLSLCLDKLDSLAIESLEALSSVLTAIKVIEP